MNTENLIKYIAQQRRRSYSSLIILAAIYIIIAIGGVALIGLGLISASYKPVIIATVITVPVAMLITLFPSIDSENRKLAPHLNLWLSSYNLKLSSVDDSVKLGCIISKKISESPMLGEIQLQHIPTNTELPIKIYYNEETGYTFYHGLGEKVS